VVNLIRREPKENGGRLDLMTGWHAGRPEQQAGVSGQAVDLPGGFSGILYYRGVNRVPVDRDLDGFSDLGKRKLDTGGVGLARRAFEGKARLTISGAVAQEYRRGGDQLDRPPHETWITEQVESGRSSLAAGWNHTLTPRTYFNLRASHSYYGRRTYYGAGMDANAYGDTRNPLWVADSQIGHQLSQHSLLAGYQYSWEHVEDNAPSYGRTYGGTFRNRGLYVQDEWHASERFTLIGGARLDQSNQVSRTILSPRAGVKYSIADNVVWRATLSTGFRAPAVFDEDLHIAQVGGDGFVLRNHPQLREERSFSFTTGIDAGGTIFNRRFQLTSSLFHTGLRDAFVLTEDTVREGSFRRLLRVNGSGAEISGVTLDADLQLTSALRLRGGHTFQRARWNVPEPQFGARDFFRTPSRYGFAGIDAELPGGVSAILTLDHTGSMIVPHYRGFIPADRLETTSRFLVANAVISRTFDYGDRSRVRLFLNVQNAGNAYQPDLDRGPRRDSAYVYGPAEMRRIVAGLTWAF
jgi:outer membrane receptor for ferrienterochelin and colicins